MKGLIKDFVEIYVATPTRVVAFYPKQ